MAVRKAVFIPSLLVLCIGIYSVYTVQTASNQIRFFGTFVGGIIILFAVYGVVTSFVKVENRVAQDE